MMPPHKYSRQAYGFRTPVSYTHLRAHETVLDLVCRLLLEKKKKKTNNNNTNTNNNNNLSKAHIYR